jgi:hypothetical protein
MLVDALVGRIIPDEVRHPPFAIRLLPQNGHKVPAGLPFFNRLLIFYSPCKLASATQVGDVSITAYLIELLNEARDGGLGSASRPPKFIYRRHSDHWGEAVMWHENGVTGKGTANRIGVTRQPSAPIAFKYAFNCSPITFREGWFRGSDGHGTEDEQGKNAQMHDRDSTEERSHGVPPFTRTESKTEG